MTGGGPDRPAAATTPTAVAALATVPFSPTCRVAACSTRPMQQACGDSALKSAAVVNATPMPSPLSRVRMLTLSWRFTLGSEISRLSTGPGDLAAQGEPPGQGEHADPAERARHGRRVHHGRRLQRTVPAGLLHRPGRARGHPAGDR